MVGYQSIDQPIGSDPASRAWQGPLTEHTLTALKGLHSRFHLPYAYLDWMEALGLLAGI